MQPEPSQQEKHIIQRLARETGAPEQEARRTYEDERERLERGAKVKTYVPVIAARRARAALSHKRF